MDSGSRNDHGDCVSASFDIIIYIVNNDTGHRECDEERITLTLSDPEIIMPGLARAKIRLASKKLHGIMARVLTRFITDPIKSITNPLDPEGKG